jgi:hypothetical protein
MHSPPFDGLRVGEGGKDIAGALGSNLRMK